MRLVLHIAQDNVHILAHTLAPSDAVKGSKTEYEGPAWWCDEAMPPGSGFELFGANNQSYHRQEGEDVRDEDLLDVGVFHFSMSIAVRLPVGFATSAPPPESEDNGVTIIALKLRNLLSRDRMDMAFAALTWGGLCACGRFCTGGANKTHTTIPQVGRASVTLS